VALNAASKLYISFPKVHILLMEELLQEVWDLEKEKPCKSMG